MNIDESLSSSTHVIISTEERIKHSNAPHEVNPSISHVKYCSN